MVTNTLAMKAAGWLGRMRDFRLCAILFCLTTTPTSAGLAQDRISIGTMNAIIDGTQTQLEIFEGPLQGLSRSLASYRTGFGGDGGMISVEAVPALVPPGAHPMQGMAVVRIEFDAPAPLDTNSPHDDITLLYVEDWPVDLQEPRRLFVSTGVVDIELDALDLAESRARIAGIASGTMCPQDIDTEYVHVDSDACFPISMRFDTALVPFAPPVPVDTAQAPAPVDTAPAPAPQDDGPVTMDVLGTVTATLDGEAREWLTIAGEMRGEEAASAFWRRTEISIPSFSDVFGAGLADQLSEQERRQLEDIDTLFGDGGPMAEMMGQLTGQAMGGSDHIDLTISGHDPASPNILTEQVLSLDVSLSGADIPLGVPVPAEINYFLEASGSFIPAVFYISGEDGSEASVTFDRLDLSPGGGHASGSFHATLCRMEGARLLEGADLDDCMAVEGTFDTALVEEEPLRF